MPEEMNRRNPFANLLPSLVPKTAQMWDAMRRAMVAPVAGVMSLLDRRRMEVTVRHSSGGTRARTNLSVHERHVRRRIRNLNRGRGPT